MRLEDESGNGGKKKEKMERNETEKDEVRSFDNTVLKFSMLEDFSMVDIEDITM